MSRERIGSRVQALRELCNDFQLIKYDVEPRHLPEAKRLFSLIRRNISELHGNLTELMTLLKDR